MAAEQTEDDMSRKTLMALACVAGAWACPAHAKPIAYARGSTAMVEYGAGTMKEVQLFYAPRYWWSAGAGALTLDSDDGARHRRIQYVRANLLVKRWNLPAAQANVFAWGGLGRATGNDFSGTQLAGNAGVQLDYETRRLYAAARADLQYSAERFGHRIDTLQLGWAPYAHDYGTVATWLVLQGRQYTGGLYDGVEAALLLRLFKGGAWVEAGVTQHGQVQAMAMFNF
jgi:hypothetical protein